MSMSSLLQKTSSHHFGSRKNSHTFVSRQCNIPVIVPCLMGEELAIDSELVNKGLSAISIKHKLRPEDTSLSLQNSKDHVIKCTISLTRKSSPGLRQRNSFWNVHRPDLAKLNLDPNEITLRKVETFFRQHSSTQCVAEEECLPENSESLVTATSCHDMFQTRGMITLSRSFVVANDSPPEREIPMSTGEH